MNNVSKFGLLTGSAILLALLADYFISPALMVIVNRKQGGKR
jgi:predicted RND superfamily exporter protein